MKPPEVCVPQWCPQLSGLPVPEAGVELPVLIQHEQFLITHGTGITTHNDLIQGRRKKAEWVQPWKASGEECWVGIGLF